MDVFCTYCSSSKRGDAGEMPAVQRYTSSRIRQVYRASAILGVGFYILSGEYGLLRPEQPIPHYDHLLLPLEVPSLMARVAEQIGERHLQSIVYFTHALSGNDRLAPYRDAMVGASALARCSCLVVEVPPAPERHEP